MPARVLASARNVTLVLDHFRDRLDEAGVEIVFPESRSTTLSEDELLAQLPGCLAAIAMPDAYTEPVIAAAAPALKLIARSGVGYDSVDLEAARKYGVWVTTTVGSNHDSVADFTLGLILDLTRHITKIAQITRGGGWQRVAGMELRGKTLGIAGTGRIGREVAARAAAFGMRIVAFDVIPNEEWARASGVQYVTKERLLAESHVVTLHMPATTQTRHFLNAAALAMCRRGACVVNTARGELIDEAALLAALDAGRIAGAALDVFASEPPGEAQRGLVEHPSVIPTGHCAGATVESQRRAAEIALEEVLRVARGERPQHVVPELA